MNSSFENYVRLAAFRDAIERLTQEANAANVRFSETAALYELGVVSGIQQSLNVLTELVVSVGEIKL